MCLILAASSLPLRAQEEHFRVIDRVDLPHLLTGGEQAGRYLEFRETWTLVPERPALQKETTSYLVRNIRDSLERPAEEMRWFSSMVKSLDNGDGEVRLEGIRYEFNLLDPHLEGSGMEGFPEPDSMDAATRALQSALIRMVERRIPRIGDYDLAEEMLSVWFEEEWIIDPVSMVITRRVTSLTPVIWQRRRTLDGEPIDEAGTGWPVYYKNPLSPVTLRNPQAF